MLNCGGEKQLPGSGAYDGEQPSVRFGSTGIFGAISLALVTLFLAPGAYAQAGADHIPRRDEGQGPFNRLILRGVNLVDGTGAPMRGPVDIVIENDRIAAIRSVGAPLLPIDPEGRPPLDGGREIDLHDAYVMPGFIDTHLHLHHMDSGQKVPSEYILKLWLAHGVTSGRTVGYDGTTQPSGRKMRGRSIPPSRRAIASVASSARERSASSSSALLKKFPGRRSTRRKSRA